jgi:hypothetical protein
MCSARAQSPKQWLVPGAGCPPLGYYGPSAVYRSTATQPCSRAQSVSAAPCGAGESVHCRPKPLRFKVGHVAEHTPPLFQLHAGDRPVREQSLHFSLISPCHREAHTKTSVTTAQAGAGLWLRHVLNHSPVPCRSPNLPHGRLTAHPARFGALHAMTEMGECGRGPPPSPSDGQG